MSAYDIAVTAVAGCHPRAYQSVSLAPGEHRRFHYSAVIGVAAFIALAVALPDDWLPYLVLGAIGAAVVAVSAHEVAVRVEPPQSQTAPSPALDTGRAERRFTVRLEPGRTENLVVDAQVTAAPHPERAELASFRAVL